MKKFFEFDGSVKMYGKVIEQRWHACTMAVTPERAIANLKYKYRLHHNFVRNIPLEFVGKITSR